MKTQLGKSWFLSGVFLSFPNGLTTINSGNETPMLVRISNWEECSPSLSDISININVSMFIPGSHPLSVVINEYILY